MVLYSDSEVNVFHPICEDGLNLALERLGRSADYEVIHHRHTGSLEMDYVIANRNTGLYLCVIEVKRTPGDVNSTRYQHQAMSYVLENAGQTEEPFYVITNLENAILFRFDERRPRVYQQMLTPGNVHICSFAEHENNEEVTLAFSNYFQGVLTSIFNDQYEYFLTLDEFAEVMTASRYDARRWKSNLAVMLYEYIRGAFSQVNRANDLHDIRGFRGDIREICNEAAQIDFGGIFTYFASEFELNVNIPNSLLEDLYELGMQNITGDSIAGVLHQIVSAGYEHDGVVPTDLELARIISELTRNISGALNENECICDPAAGSGNLISSAINVYGVTSNQIKANDYNQQLLELLSLRLGLNFSRSINLSTAPEITDLDINNIKPDYFRDVKVILLNPPFVAGINCTDRKEELFDTIGNVSGEPAITNFGQMPLEAVFLELITELAVPGTVIACVFPSKHLVARGQDARIIRQLLLSKFGLHTIFTYPSDDLFESVDIDTCVLIGTIKEYNDNVSVIASQTSIPNINIDRFRRALSSSLSDHFSTITPGISGMIIAHSDLENNVENGWRETNEDFAGALRLINASFVTSEKLCRLDSYNYLMRRGVFGNQGGTNLICFNKSPLYSEYQNVVNLSEGINSAKTINTLSIEHGDSLILVPNNNEAGIIERIVDRFSNAPIVNNGKQSKHTKNSAQWRRVLNTVNNSFAPQNTVLIPRAIRAQGRVGYLTRGMYISTNLIRCFTDSAEHAMLLASWMNTIFYQLICELSSKSERGLRKMEEVDFNSTLVPNFEALSSDFTGKILNIISNTHFLNLKSPKIREIDRVWAEELFEEEADSILADARRFLLFLANRRDRP